MTDQLGRWAWPDVTDPIVLVPVGSFEQHGPHLPLDTDTRIAVAVATAAAARNDGAVLGPTFTVTASGEHQGFPGTLSLGTDTTASMMIELARSATWASGVVFVNGHGGNAAAIARAAAVLGHERRPVHWWSPRLAGADLHAGRTETSLLLHLAPETVRPERAVAGPVPSIDELVRHGVRALSPLGVLGDPDGANAAEGAQLFGRLVDDLADAIERWFGARRG